jgi:hypothetical protein
MDKPPIKITLFHDTSSRKKQQPFKVELPAQQALLRGSSLILEKNSSLVPS